MRVGKKVESVGFRDFTAFFAVATFFAGGGRDMDEAELSASEASSSSLAEL
jgi:hypothetical protein